MTIFCRLCAELKESSEIITSINATDRLITEKLIACCQWNVGLNENNLPEEVCESCLDKLDKSWLFSQSVQLAQRKLLQIFANGTESSKQTTEFSVTRSRDAFQLNCDYNEYSNECSSRRALEKRDCNAHTNVHEREGIITETPYIVQNKPTFVDCSSILNIKVEEDLDVPSLNDDDAILNHDETNVYEHIEKIEQFDPSISAVARTSSRKRKVRSFKSNSGKQKNSSKKYQRTDGQNYCCHLCNKWFHKFPTLKGHMRLHTYPLKLKCQYCNKRFRIERHLISHLKTHTDHIDFSCEVCNKKCKSAFALKVHRRLHYGASVKMYGCEECDHFFIEVSTYYNHMRRKHGIETAEAKKIVKVVAPNGSAKPYVCEHCGKDFFDRCALKSHSLVHLDIRPFKCELCPKSFKNKYNMKSHQKTHTGEKSVHCPECGKKYSRKEVLIKHMEEHTGIFKKTYSCGFCDKVFRSSYNMQIHRRTHTGERPYRCKVCEFSATTKTQLDKHLKTISHMSKSNETLSTQYPK